MSDRILEKLIILADAVKYDTSVPVVEATVKMKTKTLEMQAMEFSMLIQGMAVAFLYYVINEEEIVSY